MHTAVNFFPKRSAFPRACRHLLPLCLAALLASCTAVQVSQDYNTHYRFGQAKTFGWNEQLQRDNDRLVAVDELLAKRFRLAIEQVLTGRGLVHDARPAFLVSYTYTVTTRLQVDPASSNFGFGYGYGRHRFHHGADFYTGSSLRQYDQGELIISIHSALSGELLWKGTGTREVYVHSAPERLTDDVNEMVAAVLAQFPPAG